MRRMWLVTLFASVLLMSDSIQSSDNARVLPAKYKVRVERNVLIPMRDGIKLAADLIRPDGEGPFPAIVEYLPYRKDDVTLSLNDAHHYFAERGFVGVRLDVRGTGGSEGVNTDEYMPVEQQDGYDAVEWLAKQSWCNGKVGMFGTSYGGFTCIQVAMHRPPHLKAIVPMYSTDDRYTDDCHYTPGGNMRMYYDVGTYGGTMVAMNALPPFPEFSGERWAAMWKDRLEKNEPYILTWMKNQVDAPYWRSASLRPGYERIQCPVFLVAGWRDGYANNMLRTFTKLQVPKKILMGPWVHQRPNASVPGPRIDYLNEVCRFFAHWLRGEDTGIMKEPPVTVYMQEYAKPERTLDITPGHWRSEPNFPPTGAGEVIFHLQEGGRLDEKPAGKSEPTFDELDYLPTVGLANGYWSAGGMSFYLADDQRSDEAHSLVYTTGPLREELRLLGWPKLILHGSSTAKIATFVAKLCDVAPDGSSALICDGSLNATRRSSLTDPKPLVPGEIYELDVPMNPIGWVLAPGHRLRLSIAGADFPNLWPTPESGKHRVHRGPDQSSRLIVPIVPKSLSEPPSFSPSPKLTQIVRAYGKPPRQQTLLDQITGAATVSNFSGSTMVLPGNLGEFSQTHEFHCTANKKDPAQASIVGTHMYSLKREDGTIEVTAESTIRATATTFHIAINLTVTRNGQPFFQRKWMASEPRRLL